METVVPTSAAADTSPPNDPRTRPRAFTLVELLVVMAVIIALVAIATPAVNSLKNSGDVTAAAYDLSDILTRARTYAVANNTYVWVGMFEENGSQNSTQPAAAGVGRVVVAAVYSKDSSCLYDPSGAVTGSLPPALLGQYGNLVKINNVHLSAFPNGTGTGGGFAGRPPAGSASDGSDASCRISDRLPASACKYPFTYPVGASGPSAQYTFTKMVQFSPRGEARINCVQDMQPLIEIGMVRTHGAAADTANKNVVTLQVSGIASNVSIYRP